MQPRRALVLSYAFPPLGGAGVQRILKFVKYLPEFGWRSTVVSTRSRAYGARDPSLLTEIPAGTEVIRTPALPLGRYAAALADKLGLSRLRAWLAWPDGGLGWAPFALVAAFRAIRRERPDVILSTAPLYSAHLVALVLRRLTGIPWIADFRDDWAASPSATSGPRPLAALTRSAERAVSAQADRVVVAAEYFELLGAPAGDSRRVTIPNGVDPGDVPATGDVPPQDRFRLSFVGTLYGPIDLAPVLGALERLVAGGEIDPEGFELRIVGSIWLPNFEAPPGVPVVTTGYVVHDRAVAEMRSATALLLYRPAGSLAPSGKIFEYLAAERPVLCVTRPDNLAARLVTDWAAGVVADPADPEGVFAALRDLYRSWAEGSLANPAQARERVLQRYSRRELAGQLAATLDAAGTG